MEEHLLGSTEKVEEQVLPEARQPPAALFQVQLKVPSAFTEKGRAKVTNKPSRTISFLGIKFIVADFTIPSA
jgi:hypothetical protein